MSQADSKTPEGSKALSKLDQMLNEFPIEVLSPLTFVARAGGGVEASSHAPKSKLSAYDDFLQLFLGDLPTDTNLFITVISRIGANYGKGLPLLVIKWCPKEASEESKALHEAAWAGFVQEVAPIASAARFPMLQFDVTSPRDLDSAVVRTALKAQLGL